MSDPFDAEIERQRQLLDAERQAEIERLEKIEQAKRLRERELEEMRQLGLSFIAKAKAAGLSPERLKTGSRGERREGLFMQRTRRGWLPDPRRGWLIRHLNSRHVSRLKATFLAAMSSKTEQSCRAFSSTTTQKKT
jgi:hypothetical protein